MQNIIYLILGVLVIAFIVVWVWGMWIAFTKGDDVIARFGRRLLSKIRPTQREADSPAAVGNSEESNKSASG